MSDSFGSMPAVFTPEALLPSQFFATRRRRTLGDTPECRLLLAMLEDAICCFRSYIHAHKRRERRLFEEAQRWMMGENGHRNRQESEKPAWFSFEYTCDVLGIDADSLRAELRRWQLSSPRQTG
jgi:hypothetical protein